MLPLTRRDLIKTGALTAASLGLKMPEPVFGAPVAPDQGDPWRGLKVGVASYTLRKFSLDDCIKGIQRVGLKYVSIKDAHLPLKSTADERKAVAQKFKDAGITPLSCGNISMENNEASVRAAFEYARDAGIPTIVCSPHPDSMAILDKMVKEFDIRIAIHNHGPEDNVWPSPYTAWEAIQPYDERVGLCIDVGHTARTGVDPTEALRKCARRLHDVHLKDIASKEGKSKPVEVGRGVLDIPGMLQALLDLGFSRHVGLEYEKDLKNPLPGAVESIAYVRKVMPGLKAKG